MAVFDRGDIVSVPLQHDTPDELAVPGGVVRDWRTGEVELIPGHVYVVWTRDDHYAKFRVVSIGPSQVTLDWAYQIAPGNQELKQGAPARPARGDRPIKLFGKKTGCALDFASGNDYN